MKQFYIDVETTGTNSYKNALVQLSGIIEIDGEEKERVNFKLRPMPKHEIDQEALDVTGKTEKELMAYPSHTRAYVEFIRVMDKYVNRFNREDKFYFIGYNADFDEGFVRAFFMNNKDFYFGSWFFWPVIDVAKLAGVRCMLDGNRPKKDFKLMTVADHFGIDVEEEEAHDAMYDIEITRKLFKKLI